MNLEEKLIKDLISKGESEKVEFKKSTSLLKEGIETICAFANKNGGYLFFGISDNGKIIGQNISDDTVKNIANSIKLNTDPKLYPIIEKIEIDGKSCVKIIVEESPLKPHTAYGRGFIRVGATNQKLDRDQYELLLQNRTNGYGFDNQVQKDVHLNEIDSDRVYEFLETANSVREINENLFLPVDIILEKLGLAIKGKLTNAALLLFGKDPSRYFLNQYEIKCGEFIKDSGYDEIINNQEYNGNIIQNFFDSLAFIQKSIYLKSKKHDIIRQEKYEFPVTVIRESLVNCIVHRDYRPGIKSQIEIRPSFISLSNPGTLFSPTITIENLKMRHPSRPGNKLIAKIFYLMGLFENWGSGTLQVISDMKNAGKPEPEFLYANGMFTLKLIREKIE